MLWQELGAVGDRVDVAALLDVPPQHGCVRNIQQYRVPEVLLDAERTVVVSGRLGVYVERVGRVRGEVAGGLSERVERSVIGDRRLNGRRILCGGAPVAETRVIKDRDAASYGGLAISEYVIGEADARPPVDGLLVNEPTRIVGG